MHALWDNILYEGYPHEKRPFTDESYEIFQGMVSDLTTRNKSVVSKSSVYENLDWDMWSHDSFDIAITLYDGITENEAASQDYLDNGKVIAESQIVLGGFRLAYALNYIFGDEEEEFTGTLAALLTAFLQ